MLIAHLTVFFLQWIFCWIRKSGIFGFFLKGTRIVQVRQKKHIVSLHDCFIANNIYQYCTFVEFKNEGLYTKGKVNVVVVPLWSKSCPSKT